MRERERERERERVEYKSDNYKTVPVDFLINWNANLSLFVTLNSYFGSLTLAGGV